jgi:hypothetical protein
LAAQLGQQDPRDAMRLQDFTLLGKKILVGIVVTAVPLLILLGSLYLTRKVLTSDRATEQVSSPATSNAK